MIHSLMSALVLAGAAIAPVQATSITPLPTPGAGGYGIGERVEVEAGGQWLPCTVVENDPGAMMRVRCGEYPQLGLAAGVHAVDRDDPAAVRKPGAATRVASAADSALDSGLRIGQYACYSPGGSLLAALGFRVLDDQRYTDVEGADRGTYAIDDGTVTFTDGHLHGQVGLELRAGRFRISAKADCEPL